jgi:hypothetical protein
MDSIVTLDLNNFLTDVPFSKERYQKVVANIAKTQAKQRRELEKLLAQKQVERFAIDLNSDAVRAE